MRRTIFYILALMALVTGVAFAHGESRRYVDVFSTLLGHPTHPILVVFPLGLFPTALLFDLIYVMHKDRFWRRASYWVMLVGFVGGLAAAVLGFLDYFFALPQSGDVHESATIHWQWIAAAMAVFAINLVVRALKDTTRGARLGFVTFLSVLGVALVLTGGFYGGHLVFDDRVGVEMPDHEVNTGARDEVGHEH